MNLTTPIYEQTKILASTCKTECTAKCNEFINKTMFNEYLWMIYAGLFLISLYFVVHDLDAFNNWIERKGYDPKKSKEYLDYLLLGGIGLIAGFIVRFLFFTSSVIPIK